jgi:hypothetical protein
LPGWMMLPPLSRDAVVEGVADHPGRSCSSARKRCCPGEPTNPVADVWRPGGKPALAAVTPETSRELVSPVLAGPNEIAFPA